MSIWFAVDALFMSGKKIRQLGRKHDAYGPAAVIAMMCAAKVQDEEGEFILSFAGLKDGAYLRSVKQAREILDDAQSLGVLEVLHRDDQDFTARFPEWNVWQPTRDKSNAARQKRYRDRKRVTLDGDVTDPSRVTSRNGPTGQDRTGHSKSKPSAECDRHPDVEDFGRAA